MGIGGNPARKRNGITNRLFARVSIHPLTAELEVPGRPTRRWRTPVPVTYAVSVIEVSHGGALVTMSPAGAEVPKLVTLRFGTATARCRVLHNDTTPDGVMTLGLEYLNASAPFSELIKQLIVTAAEGSDTEG